MRKDHDSQQLLGGCKVSHFISPAISAFSLRSFSTIAFSLASSARLRLPASQAVHFLAQ